MQDSYLITNIKIKNFLIYKVKKINKLMMMVINMWVNLMIK